MGLNKKMTRALGGIGILFLSFILLQNQAQAATCPTLEPGSLFKVTGNSAVYVVDTNLKRLYFPNSEVFYSWYKDFSNVITLSGECVDSYPSPSSPPYGINYRPGSRLIKVQISPSVYVIEPNNTVRKIASEQVARDLYGNDWSKLVRDVQDAFWPNYKNKGTELVESIPHDGMFIKKATSSDVYYVENNVLKKISGTVQDTRTVRDEIFNRLTISDETKNIILIFNNSPQTLENEFLPAPKYIATTPSVSDSQNIGYSTYLGLTAEGIIKWTNYQRQLIGLPALKANNVLANIAAAKVTDLYTRRYTGHYAPDGTGGAGEFADKLGYEYLHIGENIEWADFKSDDKAVVDAWMTSPGHKANILNTSWTEIGISIGKAFYGGENAWNVVQIFGTPSSLCTRPSEVLWADVKTHEEKMDILLNELSKYTIGTVEYVNKATEYNNYLDEYNIVIGKYNKEATDFTSCVAKYGGVTK